MRDLWRFAQAEVLDGLDVREGELTKLVLIAEVRHSRGTSTVHLDAGPTPERALKPNDVAGLLAITLSEVLS